jgi:hypothetical protein
VRPDAEAEINAAVNACNAKHPTDALLRQCIQTQLDKWQSSSRPDRLEPVEAAAAERACDPGLDVTQG